MHHASIAATLCAALGAASLGAQDNCPWQEAQHQAAALTYGPPQNCGGIDYRLGQVQISTIRDACPLFVIYVPPHDRAAPSSRRTLVDVVAQVPITATTFRCEMDWLIFIPIGSSCVFDRQFAVGTVNQLITRPCKETVGR